MRVKYTKEILEGILSEGGATVLEEYPRYNQRMRVKFRCECGLDTSKRFEMLNVHRMPYCEACSLKKKAENYKDTCMKKYGVSNAGKVPDVIKKSKMYLIINMEFTLSRQKKYKISGRPHV